MIFHTKYPKQQFRRVYRTEIAMGELCLKEKVMNTRTKDSKIVHVLINRQRQSIRGYIHDLNIEKKAGNSLRMLREIKGLGQIKTKFLLQIYNSLIGLL